MAEQAPLDPIGVGIRSPMSFAGGGLNLTSDTWIEVSDPEGTRRILSPTDAEKERVIKQAINRIVLTPSGQRFMNGSYGSLVGDIVFEANEPVVWAMAASYASIAVQEQEPRVAVMQSVAGENPSLAIGILGRITVRIQKTKMVADVTYEVDYE